MVVCHLGRLSSRPRQLPNLQIPSHSSTLQSERASIRPSLQRTRRASGLMGYAHHAAQAADSFFFKNTRSLPCAVAAPQNQQPEIKHLPRPVLSELRFHRTSVLPCVSRVLIDRTTRRAQTLTQRTPIIHGAMGITFNDPTYAVWVCHCGSRGLEDWGARLHRNSIHAHAAKVPHDCVPI